MSNVLHSRHNKAQEAFYAVFGRILGRSALLCFVLSTGALGACKQQQPHEATNQIMTVTCVADGQDPRVGDGASLSVRLTGTQFNPSGVTFFVNCVSSTDPYTSSRPHVVANTEPRTPREGAIQTGVCALGLGSTDGLPEVNEVSTNSGTDIVISCREGYSPAYVSHQFPNDGKEGIGTLPMLAQPAKEVQAPSLLVVPIGEMQPLD